jgi:hypothetical protein
MFNVVKRSRGAEEKKGGWAVPSSPFLLSPSASSGFAGDLVFQRVPFERVTFQHYRVIENQRFSNPATVGVSFDLLY